LLIFKFVVLIFQKRLLNISFCITKDMLLFEFLG